MGGSYVFNADSMYYAGRSLVRVAVAMNEAEGHLRAVDLPVMPPGLAPQVSSTLARVRSRVGTARLDVVREGQDLRRRSGRIGEIDKPKGLPWWVKGGDFAIENFGLDASYLTYRYIRYGEGSGWDISKRWLLYGSNFVPLPIAKGIRFLRPTKFVFASAEDARFGAALVRPHPEIGNHALSVGVDDAGKVVGGHSHVAAGGMTGVTLEPLSTWPGGVYRAKWTIQIGDDVVSGKKSMFPKSWSEGDIRSAVNTILHKSPQLPTRAANGNYVLHGVHRGIQIRVVLAPIFNEAGESTAGELISVYPLKPPNL